MDFKHIRSPDLGKIDTKTLYDRYFINRKAILQYLQSINYPLYLPWEKARFITPPEGFSAEEAWTLAKDLRIGGALPLPIHTPNQEQFHWTRLNYTDRLLNRFDLYMGGQFMTSKVRMSASEQQTFLTRGIIEESIASSQLEGASVTRKKAKEMIAENKTPQNKDEWMAYNNYHMMLKLTEVYKDIPLSQELLLEMHHILAKYTMPEDEIGRLRQDTDDISIGPEFSPITTYIPPLHSFLVHELQRLVEFANDDDPEHFMHPIVKAICLHFWIGYLHPFVDGNGRVARAIFYWYLLKKGYWLATYIPISTIIKRAPIQYSDAYVYTEQDDNDFTYFFDYHMHKIDQALDDFLAYIEKQQDENRQVDNMLLSKGVLNDRQKQAVHYLLSNTRHRVSMTSHSNLNDISLQTAMSDLKQLQRMGIVFPMREGKFIYYYAKPLN